MFKTIAQLLQRVQAHVGAGIAAATIHSRDVDQRFFRNTLLHLVQNSWLGQHDERGGVTRFGVMQQFAGGTDVIRQIEKVFLTFRVGDHLGIWMVELEFQKRFFTEGFMHKAAPGPQGEFSPALPLHPSPQVAVWRKENRAIGRKLLHQIHSIAAGADQIALRFHRRSAIDVTDHEMIGMTLPKPFKVIGGAIIRQGASCVEIRQHNSFLWAEDLGRLGHEMHPAEHDHLGIGVRGLA